MTFVLEKEMKIEKLKELYDLIKSVFFNQFVFIYKNQICILYVTRDDNPHKFKIYSKYFLDICEKYNLSVGISDIFFNLHDIKIAYKQTLKALDYSTISADKNHIKKTADELHVHYNTLKYRLSKIRDEYCIDFEDLNYIIKLKLSYIALGFISNA